MGVAHNTLPRSLLSEIQRNGHPIEFDVLYYAKAKGAAAIKEEIGRKEGEYIR